MKDAWSEERSRTVTSPAAAHRRPRADADHRGRPGPRVGFTEGVVTDESGAVVATATSTLLVFDLP